MRISVELAERLDLAERTKKASTLTDGELVSAIRALLDASPPRASGFDRVAYQRDYMRKRRAAAKGGSGE